MLTIDKNEQFLQANLAVALVVNLAQTLYRFRLLLSIAVIFGKYRTIELLKNIALSV